MSSSLSRLVDNLTEGFYNDKCKDCKSCLKYISTNDSQLMFKCLKCDKNHNENFNKALIKRFAKTYKFWGGDIDKFILLLRKGVYPYQYMDSWERFDETSLPYKKEFYSSLNMEEITDVDYRHAKKGMEKLLK